MIFVGNNGNLCLSWENRREIALNVAKGLWFIHNHTNHAHGNIKSSNILLDENNEVCISDFIPSMLLSQNSTSWKTKGYNYHEHMKGQNLTKESDVFAYGVLLLELLTGKDPLQLNCIDNIQSLRQWIERILSVREMNKFMYISKIVAWDSYVKIQNMFVIVDHCISQYLKQRPTMEQVLNMLEQDEQKIFLSDRMYCSYFEKYGLILKGHSLRPP